ncbi:MAG: hypothetical protein AAB493_01010, partial [Patescibacteria group bacterium]
TGIIDYTGFDIDASGNLDVLGTITAGSGNIAITVAAGTIDASTALTLTSADGVGIISNGSGLEVGNTSAIGLLQGCANNEILKWTESTSVWSCATDATSAGAGIGTVQENDVSVESAATTLDFLGADFSVTSSPAGEANVVIDYTNSGITRNNVSETIVNDWTWTLAEAEDVALNWSVSGTQAGQAEAISITNSSTAGNQYGLTITNADSTGVSEAGILINNADLTASSLADGILITSSGVDTGITDGIDVSAANIVNAINIGANAIAGTNFSVTAAGALTAVTGSVIGSQTFTTNNIADSGALTIATGAATALTLNSGTTGGIEIGSDASAETIGLGTGNAIKTINIGTGTAGNTVNIGTDNTTLDTINVGSALDNVSITDANWSITGAGALTVTSCTGCGGGVQQVVFVEDATDITWVDADTTALSTTAAITPTDINSEILVMVTLRASFSTANEIIDFPVARVDRETTTASCDDVNTIGQTFGALNSDTSTPVAITWSYIFVDAPASASSQSYIVCTSVDSSLGAVAETKTHSSITLMDVNDSADLAELYPTNDYSLTGGEVVSLDPEMGIGVKRTNGSYDKGVLGVVSTKPAMIIGGRGGEGISGVPIALSGRVPVKVSPENGEIKKGDVLTSSSIPGVAMKATKAGQMLGIAMTDYNPDGDGKVMLFIKTGYFTGSNLAELIGEVIQKDAGLEALKYFLAQKEQLAKSVNLSEINTDRLMAGLEIITPKLITDIISVNTIDTQVEFTLPPLFNKDTAGFAIIKQNANKVDIVFDNPYIAQPIVNTSISFEDTDNMTDTETENFFNQNIQSLITDKTQNGFTLRINKNAPRDIRFSWTALAVKDAKIFESVVPGLIIENPSPDSTPVVDSSADTTGQASSPQAEPEPLIPSEVEGEPAIEPSPETQPEATPIPEAVPEPEPILIPEPVPAEPEPIVEAIPEPITADGGTPLEAVAPTSEPVAQ